MPLLPISARCSDTLTRVEQSTNGLTEEVQVSTTTEPQAGHRTFFGHPWGLADLAGVEKCERFSLYGPFACRRPICRLTEGVR